MKLFAILAAALSVMSASAQTTAPTAPTDFPAELSRVYNITDAVIRSLVIAKND